MAPVGRSSSARPGSSRCTSSVRPGLWPTTSNVSMAASCAAMTSTIARRARRDRAGDRAQCRRAGSPMRRDELARCAARASPGSRRSARVAACRCRSRSPIRRASRSPRSASGRSMSTSGSRAGTASRGDRIKPFHAAAPSRARFTRARPRDGLPPTSSTGSRADRTRARRRRARRWESTRSSRARLASRISPMPQPGAVSVILIWRRALPVGARSTLHS